MLAKLKLKKRMLVGYTIPVIIYLSFAGLVYSNTKKVSEVFQNVKRVDYVLIQSSKMAIAFQGMIRTTRGYLLYQDEEFIQRYEEANHLYKQAAAAAEKLIISPEQKQRLEKMGDTANQYTALSKELLRLQKQGKRTELASLLTQGQGKELVNQFNALYEEFNKVEQELLERESQEAQHNLDIVLLGLLIGSLLIITLAILIALAISSGVAGMINQATNEIASSSTEIATTVEEQERIATQQAVAVNQTTSTMDELGASSKVTAQQAENAALGAQQILTLVDSSNLQTERSTLNRVVSLKEKVNQIAEQILRLSEQTNQIGSISTLVSDLANQTNMLALNAAVEAVRAGEHGRGFAVVASEIRKLADQSRSSAERINSLVREIKNATDTTVLVTDEGTKTVDSIVIAINDIAVNSQQISLTAKQQAIAIQQVVEAMNALKVAATETASGLTQTKIGTQKLNQAALNLKAVV